MVKIKIGIVGTGHIAGIHLATLRKHNGFIVSGVFGTNQGRVSGVADKFKVKAFTDYSDFLKECDAVLIANAAGNHLDYAVKAANEGKHLLIEKPIGTDLEKAKGLISLCREKQLRLAVNFQCRASKQVRFLKSIFDVKRFGETFYGSVNVDWSQSGSYYKLHPGRNNPELAGGGVFINQAIHYLDLALMFMGKAKKVKSFYDTKKHDTQLEDTGVAIVEFENGALLAITASNACSSDKKNRLTVYTRKGTFELMNGRIMNLEFEKKDLKEKIHIKLLNKLSGFSRSNFGDYQKIIDNFYQSIVNNEPLIADGKDGLEALRLVKSIYSESEAD